MAQIRDSSPIIISDGDADSITESDSATEQEPDWWGPENQIGLDSEELLRYRRDDDNDEVALDEKSEVKHHEAILTY